MLRKDFRGEFGSGFPDNLKIPNNGIFSFIVFFKMFKINAFGVQLDSFQRLKHILQKKVRCSLRHSANLVQ